MARKKSHAAATVAPVPPPPLAAPKSEKTERLQELNTMLVKQIMEQCEQVVSLTAHADKLATDTAILATTERDVARTMFAAPLRGAAARKITSLQAELDALAASLVVAEGKAKVEAEAREEVAKCLEATCMEKDRFFELLVAREAELVSEKAALLEKTIVSLKAKLSRIHVERRELGRQLEEMEAAMCLLRCGKAEARTGLEGLKNEAERFRMEIEEKVAMKVREMEVLGAKNAVVDEKIASLETEHSVIIAKNNQLEDEAELKKAEIDSLKRAEKKFRSKLAEMGEKYAMASAETERLQMEFRSLGNAKEAAMASFEADKVDLLSELENVKCKAEEIAAEKESVESKASEEEAKAGKLRAELEKLHISISELQRFYNEHVAKHSCLQDKKDPIDKALDAEKAEMGVLRSRIEELTNINFENNGEIVELKGTLDDKGGKIDDMNKELELLQLDIAEAQRRGRQVGMWTWLYATSIMLVAISFVYATCSR